VDRLYGLRSGSECPPGHRSSGSGPYLGCLLPPSGGSPRPGERTKELPFGLGFWPGGFDGFPGLKDAEGRGEREVTAAVDVIQPLAGKLSFRALVAVGRTANGGRLIPDGPWLVGARAGLNLHTRFGLFRLEYGLATESHRAVFIRLGHVL